MQSDHQRRLAHFLSLTWYETALRFIVTFVAKTSELLLAAGLVVSTANFLTDGTILNNAHAAAAWAWVQALALDSSLGISFYSLLQCLKQHDWVKFALYAILTGLLTVVAGAITNVDILSHAIHTTMSSALAKLGFDVGILSTLRAIAVVGFVLMSRIKDVSFKNLYTQAEREPLPLGSAHGAGPSPELAPVVRAAETTPPSTLTLGEVGQLLHALIQQSSVTRHEQGQAVTPSSPATCSSSIEAHVGAPPMRADPAPAVGELEPTPIVLPASAGATPLPVGPVPRTEYQSSAPVAPRTGGPHEAAFVEQEPPSESERQLPEEPVSATAPQNMALGEPIAPIPLQDDSLTDRDQRLERAYQSLLVDGKKVSARALAAHGHVHRSTCQQWLLARQHEESKHETYTS